MSEAARVSPGRLWRTLRHLRPRQALAQLRHVLGGAPEPVVLREPAPALSAGAVPDAPFLGAPAHAAWDGAGRIRLLNREVDFGARIDWDHAEAGPLWAFHLHQFDWARAAGRAPRDRAAAILDWIERHPRGVGWSMHPISLRAFSWGKLLLTPGALGLDAAEADRVRHSLACQIETLARHPELRLQANHLLSNRLAVVWGGLLLAGARADGWLASEAALRAELAAQVLPDGAHEERTPLYHALLLESVLDLLALARARPARAPRALCAALAEAAGRMLAALRVWTHPDGEIALFGDSAFGIAHPPGALERAAATLGVVPPDGTGAGPAGLLRHAGYARLESRPFVLVASLAGPMPAHQPGHAHCDALAFELSVGTQRVVTDTGVYEYVPGARRDAARATRHHATLEVAGREQAEWWGAHRVGGRPRVEIEIAEPPRRAVARCAGWATADTWHRRELLAEAGAVSVRDTLEGRPRPVRLALPLAPGLEPQLAPDGRAASLPLGDGRTLRIELPRAPGLAWRVERAPYFPEFGRELERACLVGEAPRLDPVTWRFTLA